MDFRKVIYENVEIKKKLSFYNKHIYIYDHGHFEVLWSLVLYILWRFVLPLKNSYYNYIPYMNKTLPTLGNEKEQQQIKLYEKLSGENSLKAEKGSKWKRGTL